MSKPLFGAIALLFLSCTYAEEPYCLNAVEVGNESTTTIRCDQANTDPLDLKNNDQVKIAFKTLEIDPSLVEFKGCDGLAFGTTKAMEGSSAKYIVAYSSNVGQKVIAPVIHELGHVVQLEASGGFSNLHNSYSSNQVELGADYLVGMVFNTALPDEPLARFERNMELAGIYIPPDNSHNSHGAPSKRIQAFRLGVFSKANKPNIRAMHENFQDNIYGTIN